MSTEKSNAAFEKWWEAPEQRELRSSCAKGWGFKIWTASRTALVVTLPSTEGFSIYSEETAQIAIDGCAEVMLAAGITVRNE
ncbi:hypothetical protein [Candidatus Symbiopectobacterium sp. NZEC135]|uniref:hypothetical protein n=1 Tax=Candidatus Symbiopectobacterium sp. NZEC135 TaxID=2820471 RepID=UPI0022265607|nr:hypothetical protein [Candidatus Symbiopectobacterium sp. NZEC135]MCW2477728.1 hypothetical protein [Candidatus Symbiopectobacterium sp. NZEC135]